MLTACKLINCLNAPSGQKVDQYNTVNGSNSMTGYQNTILAPAQQVGCGGLGLIHLSSEAQKIDSIH